jgi:hypothetical protein
VDRRAFLSGIAAAVLLMPRKPHPKPSPTPTPTPPPPSGSVYGTVYTATY